VFIAGGVKLVPVFNNLVKVSELRAYEMQQTDYANRFTVFSAIKKIGTADIDNEVVKEVLNKIDSIKDRREKFKYLCEQSELPEFNIILDNLSNTRFKEYIDALGVDKCKAMSYKFGDMDKKLNVESFDKDKLKEAVQSKFDLNVFYTNSAVKSTLSEVYKDIDYRAKAKANDIENYFESSSCMMTINGKRMHGVKLINKK